MKLMECRGQRITLFFLHPTKGGAKWNINWLWSVFQLISQVWCLLLSCESQLESAPHLDPDQSQLTLTSPPSASLELSSDWDQAQSPPNLRMVRMVRTMLCLLVMRSVMSVEFLLCHVCGCSSSLSQSDVSYDQCNGICRGQIFTKYISNISCHHLYYNLG